MCFDVEEAGQRVIDDVRGLIPSAPELPPPPPPPPGAPEQGARRVWEPLAHDEDEEAASQPFGLAQLRIPAPPKVGY